jgi:hypothetical protein
MEFNINFVFMPFNLLNTLTINFMYSNHMKRSILFIFSIFFISGIQAQTNLMAGDIAFVSMQSGQSGQTAKDRFAFILLKNIDSNTQIIFSDNAVLNSSPVRFCKNEGFSRWKATSQLPAGTVVSISEDSVTNFGQVVGGLAFSQSGDQVLAMQVQGSDTTMLAGISSTGWESTCATTCGGASNNKTCLPANLVNGINAVGFPTEVNNLFFNFSSLTGTPSEILATINNPANWTRSDTLQTWPTWAVSVTTGLDKKIAVANYSISSLPQLNRILVGNTQSEAAQIQIFSLLGSPVYTGVVLPGNNEISVAGIPSGIYFARLRSESGTSFLTRFRIN